MTIRTLWGACVWILLRTIPFRFYLAYECLMLQLQTARQEF